MIGPAAAVRRVGVCLEMLDVPLPQRLLIGVGRDPTAEQAQR